jgi:hypothetical protein
LVAAGVVAVGATIAIASVPSVTVKCGPSALPMLRCTWLSPKVSRSALATVPCGTTRAIVLLVSSK